MPFSFYNKPFITLIVKKSCQIMTIFFSQISDNPGQTVADARPKQQKGDKKFNRPMLLEFASIVSALERGEGAKGPKQPHHMSGQSLNGAGACVRCQKPVREERRARSQGGRAPNTLDSCPAAVRGKERERPRPKKHSTLKKVGWGVGGRGAT